MYHIDYAALNYYHSPISDECLCIGILFNNVTTGQRDFGIFPTSNVFIPLMTKQISTL